MLVSSTLDRSSVRPFVRTFECPARPGLLYGACVRSQCVAVNGDARVYAKDLEDGAKAVGLFNLGDQPATVTASWNDLKLSGGQIVRDMWRQKDLGGFENEFTATVAPHGVVLVKIRPAAK